MNYYYYMFDVLFLSIYFKSFHEIIKESKLNTFENMKMSNIKFYWKLNKTHIMHVD